jgi:hypothetical protein
MITITRTTPIIHSPPKKETKAMKPRTEEKIPSSNILTNSQVFLIPKDFNADSSFDQAYSG